MNARSTLLSIAEDLRVRAHEGQRDAVARGRKNKMIRIRTDKALTLAMALRALLQADTVR